MIEKKKDLSIEVLKAFAAILVMNSHMGRMYASHSVLATGGAIGDALFFFCSGYTLFWGELGSFPNWYKRRIQRIYPTIIVMGLINACYSINQIRYDIQTNLGTGWFVCCIFLYYLLLFPIRKYCNKYLNIILFVFAALTLATYFSIGIEEKSSGNIYGATYFKWIFFFMYMLFGAICGKRTLEKTFSLSQQLSSWKCFVMLIVSIVLFYGIYIVTKTARYEPYQLLSLIPLFGICYFAWLFCNSNILTKIVNKNIVGSVILFTGSLCLEIYLAQALVFTTKLNGLFPLNIPIIMIGVIVAAYIVRCISKFLLQTFQKDDYNWYEIIKPFSR